MKKIFVLLVSVFVNLCLFSQYAPAAGIDGSLAMSKDSSAFVAWGTDATVRRGYLNIADTLYEISNSNKVSYGTISDVLGPAEGSSADVMSLGDSGEVVVTFAYPIVNNLGPDFAVFENSFSDTYLEFAFVEVSSNGVDFYRFPSYSNIPYLNQTDGFGSSDPTMVKNLAGKYRQGFGVPFDLEELSGAIGLDINAVTHVKILDVVGSINPLYGGVTSELDIINDPFPSPFESGGFDLDAIGVIHNATNSLNETTLIEFSIYPNPTHGLINLSGKKDVNAIRLSDLSGRYVCDLPNTNKIDLKQFVSKGTYLLRLTTESGEVTKKVIVN